MSQDTSSNAEHDPSATVVGEYIAWTTADVKPFAALVARPVPTGQLKPGEYWFIACTFAAGGGQVGR